jgi:alpha-glucosidase
MRDASESGVPAMRPLLLDYPDDESTYGADDEFLFGSDLLVAPVLREGATSRGVYLPAGEWYDFWSGAHYTGHKGIDVPVTLASIPIFVRGSAFVFSQPVVQHTGEMPGKPLEVTLFPSGASERWLYEDDGNSFDYRRGAFARRRFAMRADGTIEIGAPEGSDRPPARSMVLTVRSRANATRVTVNGVEVQGWTVRDGSLVITMPDRFERMEIRID